MKLALFYLGLILLSIAIQVRGEDAKAVDSNEEDADFELAERGGGYSGGGGHYPGGGYNQFHFCRNCRNNAAAFCRALAAKAGKNDARGLAERHGDGESGGGANEEFCFTLSECARAYAKTHCRGCRRWW